MPAVSFDLKRSYWLATALLLTAGVAGWSAGVGATIALTAVQLAHFGFRERSLASLAVQVRALYLALLVLGVWPPLAFVHVVQAAGVWVNVVFDYCLAARVLSLLPWHRRVPLSTRLLVWTLLAPPGRGSIVERARRAMGALPVGATNAGNGKLPPALPAGPRPRRSA